MLRIGNHDINIIDVDAVQRTEKELARLADQLNPHDSTLSTDLTREVSELKAQLRIGRQIVFLASLTAETITKQVQEAEALRAAQQAELAQLEADVNDDPRSE